MDLVDDIVVILHLRKIDKLKINFDVQTDTMIAGMIEKLSSIKPEKWRQKARKEQLGSFFHNLQHINEITNFNYTAMLNMKCVVSKSKINGSETAEFQSKNIGLENVGATCYMNATMQMYVHAQVLYEFFYYYEGGKDGNRFFSMIEFWKNHNPRFGADVFGKKEIDENKNYITNWDSFNQSNKDHVKRFRKLCIKRLEHFETYKNRWAELSNNGIEELQLILQCFYDDEFYQTL